MNYGPPPSHPSAPARRFSILCSALHSGLLMLALGQGLGEVAQGTKETCSSTGPLRLGEEGESGGGDEGQDDCPVFLGPGWCL